MALSEVEKYPRRVALGGPDFLASGSINHYIALNKIATMSDSIGRDAYADIKNNSQVGVILKLAEISLSLHEGGKHVQHLLSNMLVTSTPHELWVLADGLPIRFSLHEFEHITRLNCGWADEYDGSVLDDNIWAELGLEDGVGPSWRDLSSMLRKCWHWSTAKRKMVGLLVVLNVAIFGFHPNAHIPFYHARLVTVPERFERHPWGRVAFWALFRSIPRPCQEFPSPVMQGLVQVLVVWAFEHIPRLGEMCGRKISGDIPLLQWTTPYTRGIRLEDAFEADKNQTADRKVRSARWARSFSLTVIFLTDMIGLIK